MAHVRFFPLRYAARHFIIVVHGNEKDRLLGHAVMQSGIWCNPILACPDTVVEEVVLNMRMLQLKIWLLESEPEIWRIVQVPDDFSLAQLHLVIQDAFDWEDCHLHEFRKGDRLFGLPDPEAPEHQEDEGHALLKELLVREGSSLEYEYDFGDAWEHGILLQNRLRAKPGSSQPVCIDGARAAPPEDVGGIYMYNELVADWENKAAPDHAKLMEVVTDQLGEDFDPAHFDPVEMNRKFSKPSLKDELLEELVGADDDEGLEPPYSDERLYNYDGDQHPDPDEWLEMDEDERLTAVRQHHQSDVPHPLAGNQDLHHILHAVLENQLAENNPLDARKALLRLVNEGLSRHEATHALGAELAEILFDVMKSSAPARQPDYTKVTAAGWHALAKSPEKKFAARRRGGKKRRK